MGLSDSEFATRLLAAEFGRPIGEGSFRRRLDEVVDEGRANDLYEVGQRLAVRFAGEYEPLILQYRDDPEPIMRLFGDPLHKHVFGTGTVRVAGRRDGGLTIVWQADLPSDFRRGWIAGLVEACTGGASAKASGADQFEVSWRTETGGVLRTRLLDLLAAARLPFVAATLVPVLVGVAVAAQDGHFEWGFAAATVVGVLLFQLATYTLNDAYDLKRDPHTPNPYTPFLGAARFLGLRRNPSRLRLVAYLLYGVGTVVGLSLVAARGIEILWLGLAGTLLGFLYSAPPVRLAHRGLGELAVAVGFGPLIVLGSYFVQAQGWSVEALVASLPVAFLIAAVLYLNEFPDKEGDTRVGKRTLIVRLPERTAVSVYLALSLLTYLTILLGVAFGGHPSTRPYAFPAWTLLGLLTLPLALRGGILVARNFRFPYRLTRTAAETIVIHLSTGLLFTVGYLIPVL